MCKSWCELIIALIVIVFALWETTYSILIIVIAGIVLLIHSFMCKKCFACMTSSGKDMKAPAKKRK